MMTYGEVEVKLHAFLTPAVNKATSSCRFDKYLDGFAVLTKKS
jgi:hypothetical protein